MLRALKWIVVVLLAVVAVFVLLLAVSYFFGDPNSKFGR